MMPSQSELRPLIGRLFPAVVLLLSSAARPAAAGPVISELMATNIATLSDEDGEFSDWIEIYNDGSSAANLAGWSLTDDSAVLGKWTFPAVEIAPRGFLVVFASGKDRRVAGRNLHTNFRLESRGEFLALLEPDGVTFASVFDPRYPQQYRGASFGAAQDVTRTDLVPPGGAGRFLVPIDGALGLTWTSPDFDAGAWTEAQLPIGFDRKTTPTYTAEIRTDLDAAMYRINAACFLRQVLTVADGTRIDSLLLRVRYDDGYVAFLNGQEVARRNAPAGSPRSDSRATSAHPDNAALVFEEVNITASISALRPGENVLAVVGLNTVASNSDFFLDVALVGLTVDRVRPADHLYFADPTPGFVNAEGFASVATPPQFSQLSAVYFGEVTVEMTTGEPDAVVRYTTDRTDPTAVSPAAAGPVTLTTATELRARVYRPGMLPSLTAIEHYFIVDQSQRGFTSNLPVILVNTFAARNVNDATFVSGLGAVFEPAAQGGGGEGPRTALTSVPHFLGTVGIRLRGSSSLGFEKKNYNLEIRDQDDQDTDVSLLGMPEESDWVLHGPFSDKSLMRNALSYEWSNRVGRYAVRTQFVEMYLNPTTARLGANANHYIGVYLFMEKIKRGEERIDVQSISATATTEPEITGGYMFKIDRLDPGDTGFNTTRGRNVAWIYPKEENTTAAQRTYVRNYFNAFEAALYSPSFADPDVGYARFIDPDSWIDHHILVEVTKNIDGFRLSTFLYKDREQKLHMGPIWDYNLSLGNANYLEGGIPQGWYHTLLSGGGCNGFPCDYPWWPRLFQDPAFADRYAERWALFRSTQMRLADLLGTVDASVDVINEAQARNFQRWRVLGRYDWPNFHIPATWMDEITWMKGWIAARVQWFDNTLISPPVFSHEGGMVERGLEVSISAGEIPEAALYYTLDGSDPRGDGGAVAATAAPYTGPIAITANVRIIARTRIGEEIWSGSRNALYVTDVLPLVVTEVMYNPEPPPPGSPFTATSFEFIELQNAGSGTLALDGVRFRVGVTFDFDEGSIHSLEPGEVVLVVRDLVAFTARYGSAPGARIAGVYTGTLSDAGETISLEDSLGVRFFEFTYRDNWYPTTDAGGYSLVARDAFQALALFAGPEGWMASAARNGSPGRPDGTALPGAPQLPGDLSQDGVLNMNDAVRVFTFLVRGTVPLPCGDGTLAVESNRALADVNGDGSVNLTDGIHILNYLYLGGQGPALGRECVMMSGCPEGACRP